MACVMAFRPSEDPDTELCEWMRENRVNLAERNKLLNIIRKKNMVFQKQMQAELMKAKQTMREESVAKPGSKRRADGIILATPQTSAERFITEHYNGSTDNGSGRQGPKHWRDT
jgi:phage antirepressor YoqD-like protein